MYRTLDTQDASTPCEGQGGRENDDRTSRARGGGYGMSHELRKQKRAERIRAEIADYGFDASIERHPSCDGEWIVTLSAAGDCVKVFSGDSRVATLYRARRWAVEQNKRDEQINSEISKYGYRASFKRDESSHHGWVVTLYSGDSHACTLVDDNPFLILRRARYWVEEHSEQKEAA